MKFFAYIIICLSNMLMTKDVISKKSLQTGRHYIQENTPMYIFPERMFLSDNILFMSFLKL